MEQNKVATLLTMQAYIQAVQTITKEIQDSVYEDERLERRIRREMKKKGVKILKSTIFVSATGLYKLHITAKVKEQACMTTLQFASAISLILGRCLFPEENENRVLKEQYTTLVLEEKIRYQSIYGTAHISKENSEISGDNFLTVNTEGGKRYGVLSDGMGSGVAAYTESKELLEKLQVLIEGGVSVKYAIEIINALQYTREKEVEFATLDISALDCYTGEVELWKAGAANTYICTENQCISYESTSLPIGILVDIKPNYYKTKIEKNGYIVMLTDGVLEDVAIGGRGEFIRGIIQNSKSQNPKELAKRIIEKALEVQGGQAKDDMMALVIGVWELHF